MSLDKEYSNCLGEENLLRIKMNRRNEMKDTTRKIIIVIVGICLNVLGGNVGR